MDLIPSVGGGISWSPFMLESHDELCFCACSLYAPCIIPPVCLEWARGKSYYAHEGSKLLADRPFPEGRQCEPAASTEASLPRISFSITASPIKGAVSWIFGPLSRPASLHLRPRQRPSHEANAAHLAQDTHVSCVCEFCSACCRWLEHKLTKVARAKDTDPGVLHPSLEIWNSSRWRNLCSPPYVFGRWRSSHASGRQPSSPKWTQTRHQ